MTNSSARFPANLTDSAISANRDVSTVSAIDEQAFVAARDRLALALEHAAAGRMHEDIGDARAHLRQLAVKLRDAGYWRTNKQGLRATVSLLWQADRFISELALQNGSNPGPDAPRN